MTNDTREALQSTEQRLDTFIKGCEIQGAAYLSAQTLNDVRIGLSNIRRILFENPIPVVCSISEHEQCRCPDVITNQVDAIDEMRERCARYTSGLRLAKSYLAAASARNVFPNISISPARALQIIERLTTEETGCEPNEDLKALLEQALAER